MSSAPRRLSSIDDLQWDSSQLEAAAAAGRGEHFLLTWLSACEKAVTTLPKVSQLASLALRDTGGRNLQFTLEVGEISTGTPATPVATQDGRPHNSKGEGDAGDAAAESAPASARI